MKQKNITNKFLSIFTICTLVVTLGATLHSCKSKKKLLSQAPPLTVEQLVNNAKASNSTFTTANISNASLHLQMDEAEFNMRSSIRIIKDSVISISFMPALGIELFRLNLYNDKIQIVDKINRRYAENNYDYLMQKHNIRIDYKTIEDILYNNAFPITTNTDYRNWTLSQQSDSTTVTDNSRILNLFNIQTILNTDYKTISISIGNEVQQYATIHFQDFKRSNSIIYPSRYTFTATVKNTINASITIRHIEFNEEIKIPSINYTTYKLVNISDIIPQ